MHKRERLCFDGWMDGWVLCQYLPTYLTLYWTFGGRAAKGVRADGWMVKGRHERVNLHFHEECIVTGVFFDPE